MIRRMPGANLRRAAGVLAVLGAAACASPHAGSLPRPLRPDPHVLAGGLLRCERLPAVKTPWSPLHPGAVPQVKTAVFLHLMEADLRLPDADRRTLHQDYPARFAPAKGAVSQAWIQALPAVFGHASRIWHGHGIQLSLDGAERCDYKPGMLRLENEYPAEFQCLSPRLRRACRDSIFFPEHRDAAPGAWLLFRTINALFTELDRDVIHVVVWWSLSETALDTYAEAAYSRAAGRGGPAAWMPTYDCAATASPATLRRCGTLLAHELGHALGLHHVQEGEVAEARANLMHTRHVTYDLEGHDLADWQRRQAHDEARLRFDSRK